jgi:hypothetical protein
MIMHLKSTKGSGLTDTDVSKATKVELLPPDSIDVLAKQIGVFMCICSAILGEYAPVTLELDEWAQHIQQYEQTYRSLQEADHYFATKLACFIDRRIQLYLRDCCRADKTDDVNAALLSFSGTRDQILSNTFYISSLPGHLKLKLEARPTRRNITPAGNHADSSDEETTRSRKSRSSNSSTKTKVTNDDFNSKWKVPDQEAMGFFIKRLADARIKQNNKPICFRFHSTGACESNCRLKATHKPLNDANSRKYNSFFKKASIAWTRQAEGDAEAESEAKRNKRDEEDST